MQCGLHALLRQVASLGSLLVPQVLGKQLRPAAVHKASAWLHALQQVHCPCDRVLSFTMICCNSTSSEVVFNRIWQAILVVINSQWYFSWPWLDLLLLNFTSNLFPQTYQERSKILSKVGIHNFTKWKYLLLFQYQRHATRRKQVNALHLSKFSIRDASWGDIPPTENVLWEKWCYFHELNEMAKVLADLIENGEKINFPLRFSYVNLKNFLEYFIS